MPTDSVLKHNVCSGSKHSIMVTLMHHKGICSGSISAWYNLSVALLLKGSDCLFHTDTLHSRLSKSVGVRGLYSVTFGLNKREEETRNQVYFNLSEDILLVNKNEQESELFISHNSLVFPAIPVWLCPDSLH